MYSYYAVTEDVTYKFFSIGDEITLRCKCVSLYWNGPSLNRVNSRENEISPVETTDVYGNMKAWNLSIYTYGGEIVDSLSSQLVKRLKLTGDNFDLHITNLSSADEGLYICESTVNCSLNHNRYLLYYKCKYLLT